MNIKYTSSWLKSGTEAFIEISDQHVSKGIRNVLLINSSPHKKSFELPDNDRLNSIISGIKELKDGEINKLDNAVTDIQTLSISGVGYFKWYGDDLPTGWEPLQSLIRYLRFITNNINKKWKITYI